MTPGGAGGLWYNEQRMFRRGLSLALLAILAVQLLGGLALASACFEPCADDAEESSCPLVCALCTSCTHVQPAIAGEATPGACPVAAERYVASRVTARPLQLAADIFHVPLAGC